MRGGGFWFLAFGLGLAAGFDPGGGFIVAALGEVVLEAGGELGAEALVFGGEGFGDGLEGGEVRGGIAVAPGVVGDEGAALLEEGEEGIVGGVGGHGGGFNLALGGTQGSGGGSALEEGEEPEGEIEPEEEEGPFIEVEAEIHEVGDHEVHGDEAESEER